MKHKSKKLALWQLVWLVMASVTVIVGAVACGGAGDNGSDPTPTALTLSAGTVARSTNTANGLVYDNHRVHHVIFSLSADNSGDVSIVAKIASATAPTATEINTSSSKMSVSVSNTPVNVYLAYHIDSDLNIDPGTTANPNADAGSNMYAQLLQPATAYKIYAMDSTGTVTELINITTDAAPTTLTNNQVYGFPPNSLAFVTKKDNPMVFYIRWNNLTEGYNWELLGFIPGDGGTWSGCRLELLDGNICFPARASQNANYTFFALPNSGQVGPVTVLVTDPIGDTVAGLNNLVTNFTVRLYNTTFSIISGTFTLQ